MCSVAPGSENPDVTQTDVSCCVKPASINVRLDPANGNMPPTHSCGLTLCCVQECVCVCVCEESLISVNNTPVCLWISFPFPWIQPQPVQATGLGPSAWPRPRASAPAAFHCLPLPLSLSFSLALLLSPAVAPSAHIICKLMQLPPHPYCVSNRGLLSDFPPITWCVLFLNHWLRVLICQHCTSLDVVLIMLVHGLASGNGYLVWMSVWVHVWDALGRTGVPFYVRSCSVSGTHARSTSHYNLFWARNALKKMTECRSRWHQYIN